MPHFISQWAHLREKCLFLPDYGPLGHRGVCRDAVSLSRPGNIRVRVSLTTGAVQLAILATAWLLIYLYVCCRLLQVVQAVLELVCYKYALYLFRFKDSVNGHQIVISSGVNGFYCAI